MEMTSPRRSSSQATVAASSKDKSIATGGTGGANPPLPHLDVLIEDVREVQLSSTASAEVVGNGHGAQLSPEGQHLQMLTNLQKQLDK